MQFNEDMRKSTYNSAKIILTLLVVIAHSTRMYTGYGAFTPVCSSYVLNVPKGVVFIAGLFALMSFAIELCQYQFALGHAETEDIIHNTLGSFIGAIIWQIKTKFSTQGAVK